MNFCSCQLQNGNDVKTAWVPEAFAVKGKSIQIDGVVGEDWMIVKVGIPQSEEYLLRHGRSYITK